MRRSCDPEAHEAHMALNGECPWCGAGDESAIDPTPATARALGVDTSCEEES
jgi:hypothetical protein